MTDSGKRRTENGKPSCAAVLLAAGEAVRMGVAKPAMPFGEGTMVGAVIDVARSAGLDPIVVVTGFHRDAVAEAVGETASLVHNPEAVSGNMSSLLVGLGAIGDADVTVVLLSDMPLVEPSTIEALCKGLVKSRAVCGWTRYTDGRGHPIAFTPAGVEAIGGLSGTKALWPWFDSLVDDEWYELLVDGPRPPDINTSHDYDELTTQQHDADGGQRTADSGQRNPMKQRIIDRIARNGPMRFDTYMDACLYDADYGYFSAGRVRPGTGSDFVTSPEVSPAFGALIAGWAAKSDPSGNAALVEIGAGSGALLREIAPAWLDNGRHVYAVEVSGASRGAITAEFPEIEVVASFEGLPARGDAVIIANEVLDNLPCALARRRAGSWVEIAVDADGERLVLVDVAARREVVDWCDEMFGDVDDGTVVSVQIAAGWFIEGILKRFGRSSLCIIDYGASSNELAHRDSASLVRTYRGHQTGHDWLEAPGATDITVDVNLTAIEAVVVRSGARVEMSTQRDFLIGLGAAERIEEAREREKLHAADGDVMSQLVARSERISIEALIDDDGLGAFHVILIESGT